MRNYKRIKGHSRIYRGEDGFLKMRSKCGLRNRKHWKNVLWSRSQKHKGSNCAICGIDKNLTVHHLVPLRFELKISKGNCVTLCRVCHDSVECADETFLRRKNPELNKRICRALKRGLVV